MVATLVFSRFVVSFRPWGTSLARRGSSFAPTTFAEGLQGPSELNTVQPIGRGMNSAVDIRFAHGDLVHRPAIRAIDLQRCLPRCAKALRVGLDAGGCFLISLWTGEKQ